MNPPFGVGDPSTRALAQRACARALRAVERLAPRAHPGRPDALADLFSPVRTLVIVTGTNGKSTTAHLLEQILARAGRLPVRNRDGANLVRGVAATLARAWFLGRRPVILEVDEDSLGDLVPPARPTVLVLTNVFRDQLDRYGEVDAIASRIRDAVAAAPGGCVLAANADDPTIADIAARSGRRVLFFGLELPGRGAPGAAADSVLCPRCGEALSFSRVFLSHLGHYRCPGCGFGRPTPGLTASGPAPTGVRVVAFKLGETSVTAPLVGIHGIYNAVAAAAVARLLGVRDAITAAALRTATPMPGRSEWIEHGGRRVFLGLVKNPAGFEAMARALGTVARPRHVLLLLNDRRADGGDTSWIWDTDVGAFAGDRIRVGGARAEALALRLKYAGLPLCAPPVREHGPAFEAAVGDTPPGECLYVLLNYSAMLDLFGGLGKGLAPA